MKTLRLIKQWLDRVASWLQQLIQNLREWPTLLRAWRDAFCPWRWPQYNEYDQVMPGPVWVVVWVVGWGAFFMLAWLVMLVWQIWVGYGEVLTLLYATVQLVMFLYSFTWPIRMAESFLRVTVEVLPFLERRYLYGRGLAQEAVRASPPQNFRESFWWLADHNRAKAYQALRDTTDENRKQLSREDLQKLLKSDHPGLRQEAIRLLRHVECNTRT